MIHITLKVSHTDMMLPEKRQKQENTLSEDSIYSRFGADKTDRK